MALSRHGAGAGGHPHRHRRRQSALQLHRQGRACRGLRCRYRARPLHGDEDALRDRDPELGRHHSRGCRPENTTPSSPPSPSRPSAASRSPSPTPITARPRASSRPRPPMSRSRSPASRASGSGCSAGRCRRSCCAANSTRRCRCSMTTRRAAMQDLVAGNIDLVLGNSVPLAQSFLNTDRGKDYEFAGPAFTDPDILGVGAGIAVRKDEPHCSTPSTRRCARSAPTAPSSRSTTNISPSISLSGAPCRARTASRHFPPSKRSPPAAR